jgi:hypothetical protein
MHPPNSTLWPPSLLATAALARRGSGSGAACGRKRRRDGGRARTKKRLAGIRQAFSLYFQTFKYVLATLTQLPI